RRLYEVGETAEKWHQTWVSINTVLDDAANALKGNVLDGFGALDDEIRKSKIDEFQKQLVGVAETLGEGIGHELKAWADNIEILEKNIQREKELWESIKGSLSGSSEAKPLPKVEGNIWENLFGPDRFGQPRHLPDPLRDSASPEKQQLEE